MSSCANCDATLVKYNQSMKDCERLLEKLREYHNSLEDCQEWISKHTRRQLEATNVQEAALKQLVTRLEQLVENLVDQDNHKNTNENTESVRICFN